MLAFLKTLKIPHVFVLIAGVIFVCSVLTYFIPSGKYERETLMINETKRNVVIPGTYKPKPKQITAEGLIFVKEADEGKATPTSLHGLMMAIPAGMEKSADIIFFIFVMGGVISVMQRSGVITATINLLMELFANRNLLLISLIMLVLAVGGSTLGMGEEFIPLVPIFLLVSDRMGYDRVVGLAMVILAAQMGFAAATTNPFTIGVAQGISELQLNSGLGLRIIFFVVSLAITVAYVLFYGARVKADPDRSVVAGDHFEIEEPAAAPRFNGRHLAIVVVCGALFGGILYATQKMGWWMTEMSGGFLLMGLLAALIGGLKVDQASQAFVKGMGEMVVAALVVGFARGIEVVLTDAQVLDTLVFNAASVLSEVPRFVAVQGMFLFQTSLNFLIPSGSGQAAVTMPLMAPLADVLGITRQTAVLAFQFGDGLSNTLIPTSGILMSMLALARIPYAKWLRFMLPLFLILSFNAMLFLTIAVFSNYN